MAQAAARAPYSSRISAPTFLRNSSGCYQVTAPRYRVFSGGLDTVVLPRNNRCRCFRPETPVTGRRRSETRAEVPGNGGSGRFWAETQAFRLGNTRFRSAAGRKQVLPPTNTRTTARKHSFPGRSRSETGVSGRFQDRDFSFWRFRFGSILIEFLAF